MFAIDSLSQYIGLISDANNILEKNRTDKYEVLLYRGQSNSSYELVPAIGRGRRFSVDISIFDHERDLIELARYRLPEVFSQEMTPMELLALLQHHGIPTRLLDITENPLVALYFACSSNDNSDGEVVLFKNNELDITNYPIVNAIAESYKYARGSFCYLSSFYESIIEQPYFNEQRSVQQICNKTPEAGGLWVEECCKEPFFAYAPIKSLRQQIQQGRYILFPNRITHINDDHKHPCFESVIDPMPKNHNCIHQIITIPRAFKQKLMCELRMVGISEESLFADNVDIVCKGIVQRFK